MKIIKRRGLSPVIATVLLILLVVVIISMIFVWARAFFSDQTEGSERPIGELCSGVDFIADVVIDGTDYTLEITNRGNVDISSFEIKKSLEGRTDIFEVNTGVLAGKSETGILFSASMEGTTDIPTEVEIFAILDSGAPGKVFTCYDDPEYLVY